MLHRLMAEHREELLAMAKERIRRQRPASPSIDAVRETNLPAFLDAVIAGLRNHASENGSRGADGSPNSQGELSNSISTSSCTSTEAFATARSRSQSRRV